MADHLIQVPVDLLMSPDLPATAKLIWMAARLRLAAPGAGMSRPPITSVVSRPAMLRGMTRLVAANWDPNVPDDRNPTVGVPVALLTNRKLGIEARVLYGLLLLTPGFQHPSGRFTYASLADLAQAAPGTVAKAVRELAAAEWVKIEQAHRLAPVYFQLTFPGYDRQLTTLAAAQKRLERASFFGEQLQERDYIKLGICARRKIALVVVEPDDLTPTGMREKIGNLLPIRDTAEVELLADYLEAESKAYRRRVARL